jgi:branched-chain amino acid transport system permease protein
MFAQIAINGLVAGLLYALVALGFGLIYGGTKVLHIAHGAVYTAGAYFYVLWIGLTNSSDNRPNIFSMSLAMTLAIASLIALIWIVEITIYRPLNKRSAPPLVTFLASLGTYLMVVNAIALGFGDETKLLAFGDFGPPLHVGSAVFTRAQFLQISIASFLIAICFVVLKSTSLGRNIRALSDNRVLFAVMGHDVELTRIQVLSMGSILAGAAAMLKGIDVGVTPHMGFSAVLTGAVAVFIGASNSPVGAVLGALLLGIVQNLVVWFWSGEWGDAATFIVLMLFLIVRRRGLLAPTIRLEEQ